MADVHAQEGRLDCSAVWAETVNADADIVGYGVFVAFLLTAIITVVAVPLGYVFGTLDDQLMHDLDDRIISWMRRHVGWLASMDDDSRKRLRRTFTKFILTLSDQQLVTGLAVLIAGVSDQTRLTGFEFQVVLSLAWFSSTTHLTTLDALRPYLKRRKIMRYVRTVAIVFVLGFLLYVFIVAQFIGNDKAPVQCAILDPYRLPALDLMFALGETMFGAALLLIFVDYFVRLQDLWKNQRDPLYACSWFHWRVHGGNSDSGVSHAILFAEQKAYARRMRLKLLSKFYTIDGRQKHDDISMADLFRRPILEAIYLYDDSYLSSLPGIAFSFTYGISQIIAYRFEQLVDMTAEATRMGFGQITALILLGLPFLVAAETYSDYLHEASVDDEDNSASPVTVAPVADISSESAAVNQRYKRNQAKIDKLFLREVRKLHLADPSQAPLKDHDQTLRAQSDMLDEFDELAEIKIRTGPASFLFLLDTAVSIVLGVMLNLAQDDVSAAVAIALFGITCMAGIYRRGISLVMRNVIYEKAEGDEL